MIKLFPPQAELSNLLLQFGVMVIIHSILVATKKLLYIYVVSYYSKLNVYFV